MYLNILSSGVYHRQGLGGMGGGCGAATADA